jgi:ribosomal protein L3 glutamine methyltransferase
MSKAAKTRPARPRSNDEVAGDFVTLRDLLRYAVSCFRAAKLAYGHGAHDALDEAAYLLLEALHLPIDRLEPFLDARLTLAERKSLLDLIAARIDTRKPAAYLLRRAYVQGRPFYVDERVIVPRSFIGELLFGGLVGPDGPIKSDGVARVLDLCTGGGSLAILAAEVFPSAKIDAVDPSPEALAVARRNVEDYGLNERITLHCGDLFGPLGNARYDVILSNPPYVDWAALRAFPPEYSAEPRLAHDGGRDGLAAIRRILAGAPDHLTRRGTLVCEVGGLRPAIEREFPTLSPVWLDTETSEGEVLLLHAGDFKARRGRA